MLQLPLFQETSDELRGSGKIHLGAVAEDKVSVYSCMLIALAKCQGQHRLRRENCCAVPAQHPSPALGYTHHICNLELEMGPRDSLETILAVLYFP